MMVIVPKTIHPTPTYIPLQPKSEILFVGYPPILSPAMITHAQSLDFAIIPIDEGQKWLQLAPSSSPIILQR